MKNQDNLSQTIRHDPLFGRQQADDCRQHDHPSVHRADLDRDPDVSLFWPKAGQDRTDLHPDRIRRHPVLLLRGALHREVAGRPACAALRHLLRGRLHAEQLREGRRAVVCLLRAARLRDLPVPAGPARERIHGACTSRRLRARRVGLAYIFFTTGTKYTDPVTASIINALEPILNPILVAVFYGEMLGRLSLVGAVIVLAGILYYNLRGKL